jgi:cyclohexa-1,5-dienecarbonyl-CoA hydratase
MGDYKHIKVADENGVLRITLAREPLNILNIEMMEEIGAALESCGGRTDLKAVVFDAVGKAFSAGVDVGEHTGGSAGKMIEVFHGMFRLLNELGVTSVAVVDGSALGGGCELATFCDIVIASDRSKFGQPEIQVGVFAPIACIVWPKVMGRKKAIELLLSGAVFGADEACRLGLVNSVVPADKLREASEALIGRFAALSAPVLKYTRRAANRDYEDEFAEQLKKVEKVYLDKLMNTADANEGLKAFLEKRKPEWKNE